VRLYFGTRTSLLQRWRCSCKSRSRRIGSRQTQSLVLVFYLRRMCPSFERLWRMCPIFKRLRRMCPIFERLRRMCPIFERTSRHTWLIIDPNWSGHQLEKCACHCQSLSTCRKADIPIGSLISKGRKKRANPKKPVNPSRRVNARLRPRGLTGHVSRASIF
jgi:hypothetical protein